MLEILGLAGAAAVDSHRRMGACWDCEVATDARHIDALAETHRSACAHTRTVGGEQMDMIISDGEKGCSVSFFPDRRGTPRPFT